MANKIQSTINKALGDGARNAKFRCFVNVPGVGSDKNIDLDTICKSAVFPGRITETIEYKYKGHSILLPGHEKFAQQFTLTFYLEEDHRNRKLFDNWMKNLQHDIYSDNPHKEMAQQDMFREMFISQLNYEMDKEMVKYSFYNAFPIEISQIDLSSESINAISEYSVTFAYTHYEIENIGGMLNSSEIADKITGFVQDTVNTVIDKGMNYISNTEVVKGVDGYITQAGSYIDSSVTKIGSSIKNFLG